MSSLDFLLLLAVPLLCFSWRRKKSTLPLPPGPKGLPLIGNLLDMTKHHGWVKFAEWAKEFDTDVVYLNVAGQNIVIINTAEAALELLERRSSIYSGRPRFVMVNELMGWDWDFGTMDYGDTCFHPAASRQFYPHIKRSTLSFLSSMLDKPNDLSGNLRSMAGKNILSIAYGINAQRENDPYIEVVERAVRGLTLAATPGAFLVDALPILKYVPEWMPGARFQTKARIWRSWTREMVEKPFDATKRMMAEGTCAPSFTSKSIEMKDNYLDFKYTDETVRSVAGAMYAAGAETTVAVLLCCVLGLLNRPDVVLRAQEELDRVVKPGYLPDFDDRESLPFITAITKETMRWKPVTPLAIPHNLRFDDVYNGYRIPAKSIILPNAWSMLHNESIYPDPHEFKPERFIKDGSLNTDVKDPNHAIFGFGRRICPGRYVAFDSAWLAIAALLYTFNVEKAVDEEGDDINPTPKDLPGLVNMPQPYPVRITPRSPEMEKLIRESQNSSGSSNEPE